MANPSVQRRGTVYLAVISTAAVVTTLGLTALALVRVQRRADQITVDSMVARSAAMTGLEWATDVVASATEWRKRANANSGMLATLAVGRAKVGVSFVDAIDGDLEDSPLDPVEVTAKGVVTGVDTGATQLLRWQLDPVAVPLTCLGTAVSAGDVSINNGVVGGAGLVASNSNIAATGAKVRSRVRAVGSITGGTYYGAQNSGASAVGMPANDLFPPYQVAGTEILRSSLSGSRLERVLLSPTSNPYGKNGTDVNARGIYWIDCDGHDIEIMNCRIVGTLVLLNTGPASAVRGAVCWEPAEPGMPAILVSGPMTFDTRLTPLSEADWAMNFNPSGTAYNGTSNNTLSDKFPSMIKGIVYVSTNAVVTGELTVDGVLVVGSRLTVSGSLFAVHDDTYWYSPPPGFASRYVMTPARGSLRQVVR